MELKGRVALVTGGATGIGKATALRLARAGVESVVINYHTSDTEAQAVAEQIRQLGAKSLCIKADIKSDEQVREMISKIASAFSRLDIVVNNAGMTHWIAVGDLESLSDEVWDEIFDVNVKGAFRCARAAGRMLAEHNGVIINVASISGILAPATMSSLAYGTAKAALIYLTRGLAVALAPKVRVNGVAPAFTDTKWTKEHYGDEYAQAVAKAASSIPLRRIAVADDVAAAIVGLIVGGDFVTGQTLIVDGGLSLS
jgi:3-oxoacyl-[acyl-carrier protein] reductase